jgi:nitroreductase
MELREVIGSRRSIRYYNPSLPVEREKIQKMLEAARLCSFWGNVQALRAIVLFRDSSPRETWESLIAPLGHYQLKCAPVVILWYWDETAIIDKKSGHLTQGERLHELVEARVIGLDCAAEHKALDDILIPFFKANVDELLKSGITEMDCGQGIAQATLVAYEEGLGTCLIGTGAIGGPLEKKMRRLLKLPESAHLLVLMSVGYPLESREAGGQRPRLPFEQIFFLDEHGKPFPRDEKVVEELAQQKMFQRPAPLPTRQAELDFLHKALDLPPSFIPRG